MVGCRDFAEVKKNQHAIERLIDWGRAKGVKDTEDLLWNIRQLANRVGKSPLGMPIAKHLSTYAYLEMERLKIDNQMKELEHG